MLFDSIPAELSRHSVRYQISSVLENARVETVESELAELIATKTVLTSYHSTDPNIGLSSNINPYKFKLYLADTGLMVTLMFKDSDFTENTIYTKLLSGTLPKNLGMLYENIVAQTFASKGYKLFYSTFYDLVQKRSFEVDFLLNVGNKIAPVEVKSSRYSKHRSLDEFSVKYSERISGKYVIHVKDLRKDSGITYLPFYMAQFL